MKKVFDIYNQDFIEEDVKDCTDCEQLTENTLDVTISTAEEEVVNVEQENLSEEKKRFDIYTDTYELKEESVSEEVVSEEKREKKRFDIYADVDFAEETTTVDIATSYTPLITKTPIEREYDDYDDEELAENDEYSKGDLLNYIKENITDKGNIKYTIVSSPIIIGVGKDVEIRGKNRKYIISDVFSKEEYDEAVEDAKEYDFGFIGIINNDKERNKEFAELESYGRFEFKKALVGMKEEPEFSGEDAEDVKNMFPEKAEDYRREENRVKQAFLIYDTEKIAFYLASFIKLDAIWSITWEKYMKDCLRIDEKTVAETGNPIEKISSYILMVCGFAKKEDREQYIKRLSNIQYVTKEEMETLKKNWNFIYEKIENAIAFVKNETPSENEDESKMYISNVREATLSVYHRIVNSITYDEGEESTKELAVAEETHRFVIMKDELGEEFVVDTKRKTVIAD